MSCEKQDTILSISEFSISDEDIEHRNSIILQEAEETWKINSVLGGGFACFVGVFGIALLKFGLCYVLLLGYIVMFFVLGSYQGEANEVVDWLAKVGVNRANDLVIFYGASWQDAQASCSHAMSSSGKLREAAQAGNIDGLYAIIQEDPYILERIDHVPFVDTPLHVAVALGCDDFEMETMNLKPSFARKLNKHGYSPIHLALQNEKTVLRLLAANGDPARVKEREGYSSLHYVAEHGNRCLLLQVLVDCPEFIQEVTIGNKTALHVAAKNNKMKALQIVTQSLRRTYFYNSSCRKKLELEG
ncbi:hypothetical protein DITRI_Ditri09bG0124100 [Diplodiscus trichospermus]